MQLKIQEEYHSLQNQLTDLIHNLLEIRQFVSEDSLFDTLERIEKQVQEPFMFVVVGEVKAGKSSFINALLETDEEICPVAPMPLTDKIQLIVYGENPHQENISPYVIKRYAPFEILREIAIVDTPGTNTIVAHHQEITETFIPESDLILFVFEAKNPYRQSAWDFFRFINAEWHKKIVFILQQKDLLSEGDLAINAKGLTEYAQKQGVDRPVIFSVTAKGELDHIPDSGFTELRKYISETITGGKAPFLKLGSAHTSLETIHGKITQAVDIRTSQYESDRKFRDQIDEILQLESKKSKDQVHIFVENILHAYQDICQNTEEELREGLSFFSLLRRSFGAIFGKKQSIQDWLQELNDTFAKNLKQSLHQRMSSGVIHLSQSVQQMGLMVDMQLRDNPLVANRKTELFGGVYEQRAKAIDELHGSFQNFMQDAEQFADRSLFSEKYNVSTDIAAGSGIAVIGVILTALANGLVFDITGGVLTAVGLVFAGVTAGIKRKQIINGFQEATAQGKNALKEKTTNALEHYIDQLRIRILENFSPFDAYLKKEAEELVSINGQLLQLKQQSDLWAVRFKKISQSFHAS